MLGKNVCGSCVLNVLISVNRDDPSSFIVGVAAKTVTEREREREKERERERNRLRMIILHRLSVAFSGKRHEDLEMSKKGGKLEFHMKCA